MQSQWKYSPTQLIRSKRDRERLYICSLSRPKDFLENAFKCSLFSGLADCAIMNRAQWRKAINYHCVLWQRLKFVKHPN